MRAARVESRDAHTARVASMFRAGTSGTSVLRYFGTEFSKETVRGSPGVRGGGGPSASRCRSCATRGGESVLVVLGDVSVEVVLDEQVAAHVVGAVRRAPQHVRGHRL